MKTQGQNLFIISKISQETLVKHLESRFGVSLVIQSFTDPEIAMRKIDHTTEFIVIDTDTREVKNASYILRIKQLNPKTVVIALSSDQHVAEAIHLFRQGASDVVQKGRYSILKIANKIGSVLTHPLRLLKKEFKVKKFLSIQFLVYLTMGIVVLITLIYRAYRS